LQNTEEISSGTWWQFFSRIHPDHYAVPARASHWQNQLNLLADNFGCITVAIDEILGRKILELPDMRTKDVETAFQGVSLQLSSFSSLCKTFQIIITSAIAQELPEGGFPQP